MADQKGGSGEHVDDLGPEVVSAGNPMPIRVPDQHLPAPGANKSPDGSKWWDGGTLVPRVEAPLTGALRSPDGRSWWNGSEWVPLPGDQPALAYAWTPSAPPAEVTTSGMPAWSQTQKVVAVGPVVAGGLFVMVSAFLVWYTFQTQAGLPVQGQPGFDNGGGIWALVIGAFAIVNAVGLWVAHEAHIVLIAERALWADAAAVAILVGLSVYAISNGGWMIVGTSTPLNASAGPGLILLGVGAGIILLGVIRIWSSIRKGEWPFPE